MRFVCYNIETVRYRDGLLWEVLRTVLFPMAVHSVIHIYNNKEILHYYHSTVSLSSFLAQSINFVTVLLLLIKVRCNNSYSKYKVKSITIINSYLKSNNHYGKSVL